MTSKGSIRDKNSMGRSVVVIFACEIIQIFSIQFYVDRAVHKCNFKLVIKGGEGGAEVT